MILDTSFLLDLTKSREAAMEKAAEIEHRGTPVHLSAATVYTNRRRKHMASAVG